MAEANVDEGQATKITGGPLQHGENKPIPLAGASGTTNGGVPEALQPPPGQSNKYASYAVSGEAESEEGPLDSSDSGNSSDESENDDDMN